MARINKKRRSREEYQHLLAEREREGLTFPELSKRSGVPLSTLQEWGRRLRRESRSERAFVEILPCATAAEDSRREVVLRSGRRILVPTGSPLEGLRELVALLESC